MSNRGFDRPTIGDELLALPPRRGLERGEPEDWRKLGDGRTCVSESFYEKLTGHGYGAEEPAVFLTRKQLESLARWHEDAEREKMRAVLPREVCGECHGDRNEDNALAVNEIYTCSEVVHRPCGLVVGKMTEAQVEGLSHSLTDAEKVEAVERHEKRKQDRRLTRERVAAWRAENPERAREQTRIATRSWRIRLAQAAGPAAARPSMSPPKK